ncbi:hypothetical protein [Amycolatopsis palatopharyngis]|uniref:hypothetical protein n=1 Tax=Amycolatopsis palatopharyngis TaxID=187982 RepID=UPI000E2200FC|nr:hypothetical protein [Amycolatopsis palatopharyngis]
MQINLSRLGGQLGVLLCLVGFVLLFLGWNGAASQPFIHAQFPYVISGGLVGLSVVVVGAAMIIVQNQRQDRAKLEAALDRLASAVEHQGSNAGVSAATGLGFTGFVVSGQSSYHRVDCHLPEARDEAELVQIEAVVARGLTPCRVCNPPRIGQLAN